jgi:hypothetical protein
LGEELNELSLEKHIYSVPHKWRIFFQKETDLLWYYNFLQFSIYKITRIILENWRGSLVKTNAQKQNKTEEAR